MTDIKKDGDASAYDKCDSSIFNDKIGLSIHAPDEWQKIVPPSKLERLVSTGE